MAMSSLPTETLSSVIFTHTPMNTPQRQIRLLRLITPNEPDVLAVQPENLLLRCYLDTIELSRCPKYIAVSYEWGPAKPLEQIKLDDRPFFIRQNLHRFLVRLSEHRSGTQAYRWPRGLSKQYFWIDQICVDQSSTTERNHQVQMMDDIFKNASEVIAWLGDDSTIKLQQIGGYDLTGIFGAGLWSRLWCQQEISLARTLSLMAHTEFSDRVDASFFRPHDFKLPKCLRLCFENTPSTRTKIKLEEAIRFFSAKQCTNPRDKIYGILGMVRPEERIVVDYDLSVAQVYRVAVTKVLEHARLASTVPKEGYVTQLTRPRVYMLETTFKLLSLNMGLSAEETRFTQSLLRAGSGKVPAEY